MAVFRIEKTRDYTVMANHHLRNTKLSLKAKGLLSLMLSLPEDWDYTTKGLAKICKDGVDSICSTVNELEEHGYVIRERIRNAKGQLTDIQYTILEQPKPSQPGQGKPKQENPVLGNPVLGSPEQEEPEQGNPAQLNTKKSSNQGLNTDLSNTEVSNPIRSNPYEDEPQAADGMGTDTRSAREIYREIILENIEYRHLVQNNQIDRERLDELVELIVDTVCSARKTIRIAGDDYPAGVVKSRFMKLDSSHIEYVLSSMQENTTYVRNIKKYLLAALYNAPSTISSYYTSLVNHDLYGGGERRESMQEEVTQKTMALAITTSKMTASVLAKAMRKFLEAQKNKSHQLPKGKQTLKELMKHNTGVSNLEITNDNIRAFSATAKKYGIDFALKKDSSTQPPRYLVFFKGRDADVMTAAFKEFSAKQLSQEKKPSIRKLLSSMKDLVQKKDKVLDRTKHKDRGMEL